MFIKKSIQYNPLQDKTEQHKAVQQPTTILYRTKQYNPPQYNDNPRQFKTIQGKCNRMWSHK